MQCILIRSAQPSYEVGTIFRFGLQKKIEGLARDLESLQW